MAPTASDKQSANMTPTHRLPATCVAKIDAASDEVVTATPADKSNSPPIISMDTATAGIPIVEAWYSTVAKAGNWRKGGATTEKKLNTSVAPTRAPASGRLRILFHKAWGRAFRVEATSVRSAVMVTASSLALTPATGRLPVQTGRLLVLSRCSAVTASPPWRTWRLRRHCSC